MRPLQSAAKARSFSIVLPSFSQGTRTTAASDPGRTTVPPRTMWSYWRHTQRARAEVGRAAEIEEVASSGRS